MIVDQDIWTVSAGIGAGSGNDAKVKYSSKAHAFIDDHSNIRLNDELSVRAVVTPFITSKITGVSAGGFTVGVSLVDIVIEPNLLAAIGDSVNITADSILIEAKNLIGNETNKQNIKNQTINSLYLLVSSKFKLVYLTFKFGFMSSK